MDPRAIARPCKEPVRARTHARCAGASGCPQSCADTPRQPRVSSLKGRQRCRTGTQAVLSEPSVGIDGVPGRSSYVLAVNPRVVPNAGKGQKEQEFPAGEVLVYHDQRKNNRASLTYFAAIP